MALISGDYPDLTAALQGVTAVKVFLGWETEGDEFKVLQMACLAAEEDFSLGAATAHGAGAGPGGAGGGAVPLP